MPHPKPRTNKVKKCKAYLVSDSAREMCVLRSGHSGWHGYVAAQTRSGKPYIIVKWFKWYNRKADGVSDAKP